jgi:hypothetical protein
MMSEFEMREIQAAEQAASRAGYPKDMDLSGWRRLCYGAIMEGFKRKGLRPYPYPTDWVVNGAIRRYMRQPS